MCPEHGRYEPCPFHDCPGCFVGEIGWGECDHCDAVTRPLPAVACPAGEDCPICPDCGVTAAGEATCACTATLCRMCDRCPEHASDICPECCERYGGVGRAYCGAHGWVELCPAHDDCADRMGECFLQPDDAASPTCRFCRGVGPCRYCHAHCPGCWAAGVLGSQRKPELGAPPPPCPWCNAEGAGARGPYGSWDFAGHLACNAQFVWNDVSLTSKSAWLACHRQNPGP